MLKKGLLTFGLVITFLLLTGCYVVNPQGNDSASGDQDHPWQHVGTSLTKLRPGDTLVIFPGTYTENINVDVTSGTAADPIHVVGQDGAVIKGKLWVEGANYWTFDNVDVTWGDGLTSDQQMVRIIRSHDWEYKNSELSNAHSTAAMGIGVSSDNFLVDNNHIHDTIPSNGPNQDHLIYVENDDVGAPVGTIERNILARSANGRGIKIGKGSGSTAPTGGIIVRYNTLVDNFGPSNIQLSYGASHNQIYKNLMVGSNGKNVTRYNLAGTNNVASNNLGWNSSGVLDVGAGLTDGGGNVFFDPQLDSTYHPQNQAAQNYGRYAP